MMFSFQRSVVEDFILDGESPVERYFIHWNPIGWDREFSCEVISFGATLTSWKCPEEVTLCFSGDSVAQNASSTYYLGCIVGRVANRIADGSFSLNNEMYDLQKNNGPNCLHGGARGFDKKNWKFHEFKIRDTKASLTLSLFSPDGDEGFPGSLTIEVTYEIDCSNNSLTIYYNAVSSKPTPCNLTQHSYWNMSPGNVSIKDHCLHLNCSKMLPLNENQIPLGTLSDVSNTEFDFQQSRPIDDFFLMNPSSCGIDHYFIHSKSLEQEKYIPFTSSTIPNNSENIVSFDEGVYSSEYFLAELKEPKSQRSLKVFSTYPGLQVYTGNFLPSKESKGSSIPLWRHYGVCLEAQLYPDAVHHLNFPSIILNPGHQYRHYTRYEVDISQVETQKVQ